MARKRLSIHNKRLAVSVTRDLFHLCNNREEFEQKLKADERVKAIDPLTILLFIRIALALYDYFKSRKQAAPEFDISSVHDDEAILGSVAFYK